MYARRIRILLITLLLLSVLSIAYLIIPSRQFRPGPLFSFKESPDSIIIIQGDNVVRLVETSGSWKINNRPADADRVALLLATMQQSVARRGAARSDMDSINRMLDNSGARVEAFAGNRRLLSFRVGGDERSMKTYIRKEDDEPVEVSIPGYRVYVAAIFLLPELDWLDRRIFNFNWRNFKSLTAEFPDNPADNFEVTFNGRFFSVKDLPTDSARLNTYLDEISLLEADGFLPYQHVPDSLDDVEPISRIQVQVASGDTLWLDIYQTDAQVLGATRHLPLAFFSNRKIQLFTRRRGWFKESTQ